MILSVLTVESYSVCIMNTHSAWPGEVARGEQSQVEKWIQTENRSVILNLAMQHTQLTTYLKIGRRWGGGRTRRDEGAEVGREEVQQRCTQVYFCVGWAFTNWSLCDNWCITACVCKNELDFIHEHTVYFAKVYSSFDIWSAEISKKCNVCVPFSFILSISLSYVFHYRLSTPSNSLLGIWRQPFYPLTLNIAIGELQELLNLAQLLTESKLPRWCIMAVLIKERWENWWYSMNQKEENLSHKVNYLTLQSISYTV